LRWSKKGASKRIYTRTNDFVSGLRCRVGRVQPQLPPLLHEPLDQAEQQVPALSTGVDRSKVGEVDDPTSNPFLQHFVDCDRVTFSFMSKCHKMSPLSKSNSQTYKKTLPRRSKNILSENTWLKSPYLKKAKTKIILLSYGPWESNVYI